MAYYACTTACIRIRHEHYYYCTSEYTGPGFAKVGFNITEVDDRELCELYYFICIYVSCLSYLNCLLQVFVIYMK